MITIIRTTKENFPCDMAQVVDSIAETIVSTIKEAKVRDISLNDEAIDAESLKEELKRIIAKENVTIKVGPFEDRLEGFDMQCQLAENIQSLVDITFVITDSTDEETITTSQEFKLFPGVMADVSGVDEFSATLYLDPSEELSAFLK